MSNRQAQYPKKHKDYFFQALFEYLLLLKANTVTLPGVFTVCADVMHGSEDKLVFVRLPQLTGSGKTSNPKLH